MVETYYPTLDRGVEVSDPVVSVSDLEPYRMIGNVINSAFDGDKFWNGFGDTVDYLPDYWTLRARSSQLFTANLYARGIIRRLVTNVINTGLSLESTLIEDVLQRDLGAEFGRIGDANEWTENVENRFGLWANNPELCDFYGRETFGEIQRSIYMEALVGGDCLVVMHQDRRTNLPKIQLIRGDRVETPLGVDTGTKKIEYGVELDAQGRQIAYWVRNDDNTSSRITAMGPRSGRRIAWLVYGTERRIGAVRGQPLLAIVLQSLREIDRYRDSEQRAAVINSMVAMFIEKTEDKPGTRPLTQGAQKRSALTATDSDGTQRTFQAAQHIPGLVMEQLQKGEKPVSFNNARPNVNFAVFEQAILNAMAWALELPPEVLTQSFQNNYSASRGSVNEFKIFLDKERSKFSNAFTIPIYQSWFVSMVLLGRIDAPGFLDAWRSTDGYDIAGAWMSCEFGGAIKPALDLLKEVKAYELAVKNGFATRERAARELNGSKYSKNAKRLILENEQLVEANQSMQPEPPAVGGADGDVDDEPDAETVAAVLAVVGDNNG